LSRKGAKRQTSVTGLRSKTTKARTHVDRVREPRAEFEKELEARAHELSEAREQQAATAEVLQVISTSPGKLEPVLECIFANATRLCQAKFGMLYLWEGEGQTRVAALHGAPPPGEGAPPRNYYLSCAWIWPRADRANEAHGPHC